MQRPCCFDPSRVRGPLFLASLLLSAVTAHPQVVMLGSGPNGNVNIFNTDRKLAALESAAKMLGSLPEQKALVYFALRRPDLAEPFRKYLDTLTSLSPSV